MAGVCKQEEGANSPRRISEDLCNTPLGHRRERKVLFATEFLPSISLSQFEEEEGSPSTYDSHLL